MKARNLLFITTDQQRFDSLPCYGLDFVQAPNIERIAKEGVTQTIVITCVARVTIHRVVVIATMQFISSSITVHRVIVIIAMELIVASVAPDGVIPRTSINGVYSSVIIGRI